MSKWQSDSQWNLVRELKSIPYMGAVKNITQYGNQPSGVRVGYLSMFPKDITAIVSIDKHV